MAGERSRYGLLISAAGAILLAVAVFLPWYGVSFTANGIAMAQRIGSAVVSQFGNANLQSQLGTLNASIGSLADHQVAALSAHQVLKVLNIVLLIAAGLACVIALIGLAGPDSASSQANRSPLALIGVFAALCVVYRMIDRPAPEGDLIALSLREGAWVALLGSLAITVGALLGRRSSPAAAPATDAQSVWSDLSGWTPGA
jgi:hypothetical protein